jgi:hypothetical protein
LGLRVGVLSYHRLGRFNPVAIDAQPFARRSEGVDLSVSDDKYETTKTIHRGDEGWLREHRLGLIACRMKLASNVVRQGAAEHRRIE